MSYPGAIHRFYGKVSLKVVHPSLGAIQEF